MKLLCSEHPFLCLILLLLQREKQKASAGSGDTSPAETLVDVVYLLLEPNLFFILLKSQNVTAEKKCSPLSI